MNKVILVYFFVLVLLSCFLPSCKKQELQTDVPYYNTPDFTPVWVVGKSGISDSVHKIASFNFLNQDNSIVTNETFKGKIYVANFFFTSCPGICPKMRGFLQRLTKEFKDEPKVKFISHSVTPEMDSVEVLKAYATRNNISSDQWHLVTGSKEKIYSLARQSYFVQKEPGIGKDSTEFLHSEHCVLIDGKGRIRGIYNGTLELEIDKLEEDIHLLLKEDQLISSL